MDVKLKDTVPPHNIEAEKATLGAMLLDWDSVNSVLLLLRPDDFYVQQNQVVFEGIASLSFQGIKGDSVTLVGELSKTGKLDAAGGVAYISSLTSVVPTSANVEYYAKLVSEASIRRGLIKIARLSLDSSNASAFTSAAIFMSPRRIDASETSFA